MSKKEKKQNPLVSFLIRFGLSALLLGYLFSKIDFHKILETIKAADITYLFYAFIFFALIHVIILWRWVIYIRALHISASFFTIIRYFFIGLFGNLFLPSSIGGDVIKIMGLCKNSSQKERVVASVLLDRLTGFACMAVVAIVGFIIGHKMMDNNAILISISFMTIGSMTAVTILFNKDVYKFFCRLTKRFPNIQQSLTRMHEDILMMKSKKLEALKALFVSCFSQIFLAVTSYFIARALGENIPLIYFIVFVPMICVATSLPSIGGLGVREAGAVYLFSKIGVSSGISISISLINFMFMVIIGLMGGLFYVATVSFRRVQHYPSSAVLDIKKPL